MRGRRARSDAAPRSADDRAMTWLARREYSRHELQSRLQQAGHTREEIDTTLSGLIEAGYLSDERFADMLVRSRIRQGYGPARLRAELRTHALSDELIEATLESAEVDWQALAVAKLRSRVEPGVALEYAQRMRHMQYLVRRGFDVSTARAAIEAATSPL